MVGWWPFLQDIVPTESTGRFFARLRTYWQSAGLVTLLAIALFLGNVPTQQQPWWRFEVILVVGLLGFAVRAFSLLPIVENPPTPDEQTPPRVVQRFAEVFADRKLRRLLAYITVYVVAASATVPFKIKLLKDLDYSYGFILAATAMVNVGAIISLKYWGRMADRFGNRAIFSISHVGMIVTTCMWILVDSSDFAAVLVFGLFLTESIFNSGNGIAQTRYIIHAVDPEKQNQMNVITMITTSVSACAPLLAGLFLHLTSDLHFHSGAVTLNNYHCLFLLVALMFIIPHRLRRRLGLRKETPTTHVLAFIAQNIRQAIGGPFVRLTRKSNPPE